MDVTVAETTGCPSEIDLLDWSGALNSAATTLFAASVWPDACPVRDRALHVAVTGASSDAPAVAGGAFAEAVMQVAAAWFGHRRPIQRHAVIFEMEIALRLALHGLACAPMAAYASGKARVSERFDWTVPVETFLRAVARDEAQWRRVLKDLSRQAAAFDGGSVATAAASH